MDLYRQHSMPSGPRESVPIVLLYCSLTEIISSTKHNPCTKLCRVPISTTPLRSKQIQPWCVSCAHVRSACSWLRLFLVFICRGCVACSEHALLDLDTGCLRS